MFFKRKDQRNIISSCNGVHFLPGSEHTPKVFNSEGKELMVWYLDDPLTIHTPYSLNAAYFPENIWWDRFNTSLHTRFFAHDSIFGEHADEFEHVDYALLYESEAIVPSLYEKALENRDIIARYKYIFTGSKRLLDEFENARFIPGNGLWYGSDFQGGKLESERYKNKSKNISIVSSNKASCEGHKLRLGLAQKYLDSLDVDAYGSFGGMYLPKKNVALDNYRYSIVVENDFQPLYFTEKILDCFAAQTVPIYIGAKDIGCFFNEGGIINVRPDEINRIDEIIRQCCEEDYEQRVTAILDNYSRVMKYFTVEDYIFREYF